MVTFGNREVELSDVLLLDELAGSVEPRPGTQDEVNIRFMRSCYTPEQVMQIIQLVQKIHPSECEVVDGTLRLWWD